MNRSLTQLISFLEGKIAQLREKIEILTPSGKQKRGLVNGLGSIVKSITGNMDANDGQEIEEKIDTLKEKERNLTNALLDQEAFNNEIQIRFQDIAKGINQEQAMISRFLETSQNKIFKELSKEQDQINKLQYIYRIDRLVNHLNDLSESIIMAKIKIIPNTRSKRDHKN